MPIIGSGKNHLQWIDVDDLMDALLLAGEKGKGGQVYLVAAKEAKTQEELYTVFAGLLNVPPPQKHVSVAVITAAAYLELIKSKITRKEPKVKKVYIYKMASDRLYDTSNAAQELGFSPKVTYEKWVGDLVLEYLEKEKSYND